MINVCFYINLNNIYNKLLIINIYNIKSYKALKIFISSKINGNNIIKIIMVETDVNVIFSKLRTRADITNFFRENSNKI